MALTQIKADGIADDAVTLAKQAAGTDGQIITYDASGNPTAVGPGSDGQVLTSTGAGSPPAFEAIPATDTSAHVTVTDNEATNENNLITFVENAQDSTGSHGLEMDGNFHYNPSTGTCSATAFSATNVTATGTVVANDDVNITAASSNLLFGSTNKVIWDSDDSDTNKITLKATTTLTKDSDYVLPEDGAANTFLKTNGSGALSWAAAGGGAATNLIQNGAMNVAQRATSSTAGGYKVMDRWQLNDNNTNVTITQSQHALTSGDTGPWAKGFRNSYSVALSAAGNSLSAASYCKLKYMVEAQDVACSGWDYTSASSYVTLSFWFKCSTNQTFHGRLETNDGTAQNYPFSFTASGNNTWTKITKTIPGHANLTINNDNGVGLGLNFSLFSGTDRTGSVSLNTWAAYSSATRYPDDANTWITAGASTFEITGVQLEVGSTASEFAFKPYAEDLRDCQRYYWKWDHDNSTDPYFLIFAYHASYSFPGKVFDFPVVMRSKPTGAMSGGWKTWNSATSGQQTLSNLNFANNTRHSAHATYWQNDGSNWSQGDAGIVGAVDADCICTFDAEL
jgi:hypothetical protein